jgi:dihydrofolate reductase
MAPRLSLVAALAENGVIGRDGDLPWHLPADLRRFKRLTTGGVLLMGRRTWDSIGRPLPRRRSLVLSRDPHFHPEGAEVFPTLEAALEAAGAEEVFVVGGAAVYAATLPRASRLYLTHVHTRAEGDVYFPSFAAEDFELLEEEHHPADPRHAHAFTFSTYQAVSP